MSAPFSLTLDDFFSADNIFLAPSPSSDRPSSTWSLPRTVSRPGSWIDFDFDDEPDLGLHRHTSLAREIDTFENAPTISEGEAQTASEGTADCPTFELPTQFSESRTDSSIYELLPRSSMNFDDSEDDKETWRAETSSQSNRQSRIQSRRLGFYGSPSSTPSSVSSSLPCVSSSDESANRSIPDLAAVSALSRFIIDLHRSFPMDVEAFDTEAFDADEASIDDPWLAFEDELMSGLEGDCTAVLRTRVVGRAIGRMCVDEQRVTTPRKLSLVPEENDDDEFSSEGSVRATGIATSPSGLDKPIPRLPSGEVSDAGSLECIEPNTEPPSTPRNPHPPVMIAPLITLDEARKRFAHAHSLDLPSSSAPSHFFSQSVTPPRRPRSWNQKYRLFHLGDKAI